MPAHKKKRVNKAQVERAAVESQYHFTHDSRATGHGQQSLFLSLAAELLLEIVSYLPSVPKRVWLGSADSFLPSLFCERPDVLRALSQTCQAFRKVFLPLLWERLEVCTARRDNAWYLQVSATLEARSIGLSTRQDLAAYVRIANVVLTRCSTETVIPEFAKCLTKLPNLHTLQIIHAHSQMTTALGKAFARIELPSVHTVTLPGHAHNILRSCPQVRTVICTEGDSSKLVGAIIKGCTKVEVMKGFYAHHVPQMKRLIRAAPNLRCFEITDHTLQQVVVEMLSTLKKLSTIEIVRLKRYHSLQVSIDTNFENIVRVVRMVLQKVNCDEKKFLRVVSRSYHKGDNIWRRRNTIDGTIVERVEEFEI